jgi:hypothetical protein
MHGFRLLKYEARQLTLRLTSMKMTDEKEAMAFSAIVSQTLRRQLQLRMVVGDSIASVPYNTHRLNPRHRFYDSRVNNIDLSGLHCLDDITYSLCFFQQKTMQS